MLRNHGFLWPGHACWPCIAARQQSSQVEPSSLEGSHHAQQDDFTRISFTDAIEATQLDRSVKSSLLSMLRHEGFTLDRRVGPYTLASYCHALSFTPQFQDHGYDQHLRDLACSLLPASMAAEKEHFDREPTMQLGVKELACHYEGACDTWERFWERFDRQKQPWWAGWWAGVMHAFQNIGAHVPESQTLLSEDTPELQALLFEDKKQV